MTYFTAYSVPRYRIHLNTFNPKNQYWYWMQSNPYSVCLNEQHKYRLRSSAMFCGLWCMTPEETGRTDGQRVEGNGHWYLEILMTGRPCLKISPITMYISAIFKTSFIHVPNALLWFIMYVISHRHTALPSYFVPPCLPSTPPYSSVAVCLSW